MSITSSQSGIPRRYLLAAFAAVLLTGSLWSILRETRPPETGVNMNMYAMLGGQAAEKTLLLVERGGSVLIVEPRLFGHAAPGMQAMIRAYEKGLHKAGVSVAARELITLPGPADEPREEPWTPQAMREKYPDVDAISSFAGPPVKPVVRGERLPLLVFCAEPVDARALLRRGEAEIVIAPRQGEGEPPGQASDVYAILAVGDPQ